MKVLKACHTGTGCGNEDDPITETSILEQDTVQS